jgi:hypothetical protein
MKRDEAIEKAFAEIREHAKNQELVCCTLTITYKDVAAVGKVFGFDPPRRIPPKGTPVRSSISRFIGYSQGTTDACGRLECYDYVRAEENVTGYKLSDWIELQEVKP